MTGQWRTRRARRRLRPGDGRPLTPLRWWQAFSRWVMHIDLPAADHGRRRYTIDIRHEGDTDDGEIRARLYRDGRLHAVSKVPASFPVDGGAIEVAVTANGLRRCHYVGHDGTQRALVPDPRSGAGMRARLDRRHPTLSRSIATVSVLALVIGLGVNLLQVAQHVSEIPPVAAALGTTFDSPVDLPLWLNISLALAAAFASTERALRLRYSGWLEAAGT